MLRLAILVLSLLSTTSAGVFSQTDEDYKLCATFYDVNFVLFATHKYDTYFTANSTMVIPQAGKYTGPDDIAEYINFAIVSPYLERQELAATSHSFKGRDENGLCVFSDFILQRIQLKSNFSTNQAELEYTVNIKVYYDPATRIIPQVYVSLPVGFLEFFFESLDTEHTAEFICDVFLGDGCGQQLSDHNNMPINAEGFEQCKQRFAALPLAEGEELHIDGDTKGCRMLHGVFAGSRTKHCPHISFEPLEDQKGEFKCQNSYGRLTAEYFDEEDLADMSAFRALNVVDDATGYNQLALNDEVAPKYAERPSTMELHTEVVAVTGCALPQNLVGELPPWMEADAAHMVRDAVSDDMNLVVTFHVLRAWASEIDGNYLGPTGSWFTMLCAGLLSDTSEDFLSPLHEQGVSKVEQLRCVGQLSKEEGFNFTTNAFDRVSLELLTDGKTWSPDLRMSPAKTITPTYDFEGGEEVERLGVTVDGRRVFDQVPRRDLLEEVEDVTWFEEDDVELDTYHLYTARNYSGAYYGTIARMSNREAVEVKVRPVSVSVSADLLRRYMDWDLPTEALHSCASLQHVRPEDAEAAVPIEFSQLYSTVVGPREFAKTVDGDKVRAALFEGKAEGNFNLQDELAHGAEAPADPSSVLLPFVNKFRMVCAVLVLSYFPVIAFSQYRIVGKYPSRRFDGNRKTILLHIVSGTIVLFVGVFLTIDQVMAGRGGVRKKADVESEWRQPLYYVTAGSGIVHSFTVLLVTKQVMGERRITVPLYVCAGAVNLYNSLVLCVEPTLEHAFLLWGSMCTFIFVRFYLVFLSFADIDFELNYTYCILAAAATTYPLSLQPVEVFYLLAGPLVYAPFHERFCKLVGWHTEDTVAGNEPAQKNVKRLAIADIKGVIAGSREGSREVSRAGSIEVSRAGSCEVSGVGSVDGPGGDGAAHLHANTDTTPLTPKPAGERKRRSTMLEGLQTVALTTKSSLMKTSSMRGYMKAFESLDGDTTHSHRSARTNTPSSWRQPTPQAGSGRGWALAEARKASVRRGSGVGVPLPPQPEEPKSQALLDLEARVEGLQVDGPSHADIVIALASEQDRNSDGARSPPLTHHRL